MKTMTYAEATKFLTGLLRTGIKLGLAHTRELFDLLGSPDRDLKFIHLAGSNGKGSCGAMLNATLRSAGFKVGFYSSPHLISVRERIRINGEAISEEDFTSLVSEVAHKAKELSQNGKRTPTFFEFVTAMAALCFAKNNVDFVVWETGMGGRFDSTNVVEPICAVITGIALDHQKFLGDSIAKIAVEKAGIIKHEKPVFCGILPEEAVEPIVAKAKEETAPIFLVDKKYLPQDYTYLRSETGYKQTFCYCGHQINLSLLGEMQRSNFILVYKVLEFLLQTYQFPITDALTGLERAVWPARCQFVKNIMIDGAHNPNGIEALVKTLRELPLGLPVPIIFGSFKDKDSLECLELLQNVAARFIFVPIQNDFREGWNPQQLCSFCAGKFPNTKAQIAEDVTTALNVLATENQPFESAIICGSLFLAGEALQELLPADEVINI